jgi:hypothetical protein
VKYVNVWVTYESKQGKVLCEQALVEETPKTIRFKEPVLPLERRIILEKVMMDTHNVAFSLVKSLELFEQKLKGKKKYLQEKIRSIDSQLEAVLKLAADSE